ncbi:hypothetical protein XENORESO_008948, partial [Xenotaenia resolanae]
LSHGPIPRLRCLCGAAAADIKTAAMREQPKLLEPSERRKASRNPPQVTVHLCSVFWSARDTWSLTELSRLFPQHPSPRSGTRSLP